MTLLKDNNYKDINVALLSLEADIKNKITGSFDTSAIDKQLAEINSRIDKINAGGGSSSSDEIEDINSKLNSNSIKIRNIEQNIGDIGTQINGIEQKLSDIFSAENKVTDFNTTTNSGIYYWVADAANRPTDYGVLLVNKYDGGDSASSLWINQIAYGTNNKIYFRQNINSAGWTSWQQLATTDSTLKTIQLSGTVDCNMLTEPGLYTASSNAVSALTNTPANIGSAVQLAGGFSILVTKTNADGVYYGMQMFIPYGSDAPFIRKSYYLNGQHWTSWEQLVTDSNLSPYYHKCIYARTNRTGAELVKTLALEDGKCYTIEGYQGNSYRRTRVYFFSGAIRTIDEITSQANPFSLSYNGTVLTITFANWSYNQCRIYEESPANNATIG